MTSVFRSRLRHTGRIWCSKNAVPASTGEPVDGLSQYLPWLTYWPVLRPKAITAAQALAVFEVPDDLRDLVVDGYAKKIQQNARLDRTVTTPIHASKYG